MKEEAITKPKKERRSKKAAPAVEGQVKPRRRKTDTRKIKTTDAQRRHKIGRYLKAAVYNASKIGETKLIKELYATGWVPESEDGEDEFTK